MMSTNFLFFFVHSNNLSPANQEHEIQALGRCLTDNPTDTSARLTHPNEPIVSKVTLHFPLAPLTTTTPSGFQSEGKPLQSLI